MRTKHEDRKTSDAGNAQQDESSACGAGCGCHASGKGNRARGIAGVIIILAAGALVARAIVKNSSAPSAPAPDEFAALSVPATSAPATAATVAQTAAVDTIEEIASFADLNVVAADTGGVFIFLAGKNDPQVKTPLPTMRSAVKTIESRSQIKLGIFRLKTDSRDYAQIAMQMPVPGVLAMVKGGGMSAASGDITEAKLIQAFVGASSGGGCGPSSAGCGPRGCN